MEEEESLLSALWGKLICNILVENYGDANEDSKVLREKLEKEREKATHMQILAGRINLLHTILFLEYNYNYNDEALEYTIDTFATEKYLNAIQVGAPHLLRYLVSSFLLLKPSAKFDLSKLIGLLPYIRPEVSNYSDCLTEFVLSLLEDFDFKKTQEILKRFKKELTGDYFLQKHIDTLVNNAQTIFFEVFCKIYRKIEIKTVASFLDTDLEKAEIWIVNLIRNANYEAKVNADTGVINLTSSKGSVYESVFNKTRDILPRTNILINNISRILKSQE